MVLPIFSRKSTTCWPKLNPSGGRHSIQESGANQNQKRLFAQKIFGRQSKKSASRLLHTAKKRRENQFRTMRQVLSLTEAQKSCPLRSEEHTSELQSLRHLVC